MLFGWWDGLVCGKPCSSLLAHWNWALEYHLVGREGGRLLFKYCIIIIWYIIWISNAAHSLSFCPHSKYCVESKLWGIIWGLSHRGCGPQISVIFSFLYFQIKILSWNELLTICFFLRQTAFPGSRIISLLQNNRT